MIKIIKTISRQFLFLRRISWKINRKKLKIIKLVVFDVDGVLTDGGILVSQTGEVCKKFNVKDGLGIHLLQEKGIEIAFISGGLSGSTEFRAKQLNVKYCYVGVKDKSKKIKELQKITGINKNETVFLGDDINDLIVKKNVSLLIVPSNASQGIIEKADIVLKKKGGSGAVREFVDKLLTNDRYYKRINKEGWTNTNL